MMLNTQVRLLSNLSPFIVRLSTCIFSLKSSEYICKLELKVKVKIYEC